MLKGTLKEFKDDELADRVLPRPRVAVKQLRGYGGVGFVMAIVGLAPTVWSASG